MARTQNRGLEIGDSTIWRDDLNVATAGQAVIRRVLEVANSGIKITDYTGADIGTGDVTFGLDLTYLNTLYSQVGHGHGNITSAGAIGATATKPIITTTAGVLTAGSFGTAAGTFCVGNDSRLSNARIPTAHAFINPTGHTVTGLTAGHFLKALTATTYGFAAHGLSYGDVGAQAAHASLTSLSALTYASGSFVKMTAAGTFALDTTAYLATTLKGSANGLAELDANGFVKNTQLPSYVDDVLEYANLAALPGTGESGKIYITIDTNLTYRWSGTVYAEISASLALGETSATAYRGDRGKTAYDHTSLTTEAHGLGGSAFHSTDYYQVAGSYAPSSGSANYIQNQNTSAQSAYMWISGTGKFGNGSIDGNVITVLSSIATGIRFDNYRTDIDSRNWGIGTDKVDFGDFNVLVSSASGGTPLVNMLNIKKNGAATFASTVSATQFQSTIATGTAPLTVSSTTLVSNLNADLLDGHDASYFQVAGSYWYSGSHPTTISGYGITDAPTAFPGFGTSHSLAAYGDHAHAGVYDPAGTTATHAALTTEAHGLGGSAFHSTDYYQVAGSANYIQNQNTSAQSANMWISGTGKFGNGSIDGNVITVLSSIATGIRFDNYRTDIDSRNWGIGTDKVDFGDFNVLVSSASGGTPLVNMLNIKKNGAATFASTVSATQFQSTIATGTAPLTVSSTTLVSNLNADLLDGHDASYFQVAGSYWYSGSHPTTISGYGITDAPTAFPGFGTSHSLAAYGDHAHAGVYDPAGTTATHAALTTTAHGLGASAFHVDGYYQVAGSYWYSGSHPTTIAGYGITDAPAAFPGFGTSHSLAAYGDHTHSGYGSGDVVGPASATSSCVALFDGTTGKLLKNSSLFYDNNYSEISAGALYLNGSGAHGSTLTVVGGGSFSSSVSASNFILSSDRRRKTGIEDYVPEFLNVTYRNFFMKDDLTRRRSGVIHDELKLIAPELTYTDIEGYGQVAYIDLLVRETAWLKHKISPMDELVQKVANLEEEVRLLKTELKRA